MDPSTYPERVCATEGSYCFFSWLSPGCIVLKRESGIAGIFFGQFTPGGASTPT
jgi:hypothetical protein